MPDLCPVVRDWFKKATTPARQKELVHLYAWNLKNHHSLLGYVDLDGLSIEFANIAREAARSGSSAVICEVITRWNLILVLRVR